MSTAALGERPLRVAMLAPIAWRVPPHGYGPWELVTSLLTEGLVRRGVDVTLFATADSQTAARLVSVAAGSYNETPGMDAKVWECLHIAEVFEQARAGKFDLIHNQFDFLPLSYSRLVDVPVVTTIHGFSSERIVPVYEKYNDARNHYVAISDADRHPRLRYAATIHHGIPMEGFPPRFDPVPEAERYLLFFGRIHPDKGVTEAIDLAEACGRPLKLAGIVQDRDYYGAHVLPRLKDVHEYIGPVRREDRAVLLGGADALLHLINFDEPFGLSVVEAMACGTPVLARPRGSMPEIVRPGVNGFLPATAADDAAALSEIDKLDRRRVRESVVTRFGVERMVDDYLALYRRITTGPFAGQAIV